MNKELTARKKLTALALAAVFTTLVACSSDDDSSGTVTPVAVSEAGTFQVSFTNMTSNQLMTPPVAALHDPSVHLFQIGEPSSDAVRDIAETGNSDALVAFAVANPAVVSAAGLAGDGPFGPGVTVTTSLTTTEAGQVFSAVNMVICTNDGIAGVDSLALPADNEPVTLSVVAYDAGTRENSSQAGTFFPPPCRVADTIPTAVTTPRVGIALHPGQTVVNRNASAPVATDNWDLASGAEVLMIEITRN